MKPAHMVAMLLSALLVLYPLSTGPVIRNFYRHHTIEMPLPQAIRTFYAPLLWACRFPPFGEALNWYGELWGVGAR